MCRQQHEWVYYSCLHPSFLSSALHTTSLSRPTWSVLSSWLKVITTLENIHVQRFMRTSCRHSCMFIWVSGVWYVCIGIDSWPLLFTYSALELITAGRGAAADTKHSLPLSPLSCCQAKVQPFKPVSQNTSRRVLQFKNWCILIVFTFVGEGANQRESLWRQLPLWHLGIY